MTGLKKNKSGRFWEIDFLRGIAILMMITYHILFDVNFFGLYPVPLHSLPFRIFLYPIGTLFLLLVGISLTLSYSRAQNTATKSHIQRKFILRGLEVFGAGLLITAVTWWFVRDSFIVFGILHCIGVSIIFAYPFLRRRFTNLVLGISGLIVGVFLLMTTTVDFPWLLWLGFVPSHFSTLDYFPLLPWFGVVLIGIFLGNTWYQNNRRAFTIKDLSGFAAVRGVCFLGRHSLIIYLLHQLVIIGLLYLFFL